MGQYQTGTVTVVQGSNKVSGESCAFLTNSIATGHAFKIQGEDAIYSIGAVNSELTFSLTSVYAGTSKSGESYQITRDFTTNYDIPEVWIGDKDWPFHITQGLRIIDTQLGLGSLAQATVVDQGQVGVLNLTTDDLQKVHLLQNTGEASRIPIALMFLSVLVLVSLITVAMCVKLPDSFFRTLIVK